MTSWLTRTANEYGYKPYILCQIALNKKVHPYTDFDLNLKGNDLKILAELSGQSFDELKKGTFKDLHGWTLQHSKNKKMLLDNRLSLPPRQRRVAVCPECLTNSKYGKPYLRKEWRISYNTVCHEHKLQLIDKCTRCKKPFYSTSPFILSTKKQICHHCKKPIQKMKKQCRENIYYKNMFLDDIFQGNGEGAIYHLNFYYNIRLFDYIRPKNYSLPEFINFKATKKDLRLIRKHNGDPLGKINIHLRHVLMPILIHIYEYYENVMRDRLKELQNIYKNNK